MDQPRGGHLLLLRERVEARGIVLKFRRIRQRLSRNGVAPPFIRLDELQIVIIDIYRETRFDVRKLLWELHIQSLECRPRGSVEFHNPARGSPFKQSDSI